MYTDCNSSIISTISLFLLTALLHVSYHRLHSYGHGPASSFTETVDGWMAVPDQCKGPTNAFLCISSLEKATDKKVSYSGQTRQRNSKVCFPQGSLGLGMSWSYCLCMYAWRQASLVRESWVLFLTGESRQTIQHGMAWNHGTLLNFCR